jgi:hypothetical protein
VPLVHHCAAEGCTILTMGEFCLEHERPNDEPLAVEDADDAAPDYTGPTSTTPQ